MLTVLLATRNRAQILRNVLESYCQLQSPASGWKLVVVDNGSTDQTAEILASYSTRLPIFSLREQKLGKNFALNTGLALLEGDLAVFTDDDAFPRTDWLLQLRKAAASQPAYSMFGGTVIPRWEAPPPSWISWIKDPGPVFTLTDPSLKEGQVAPFLVFGPNMAVRASIFQSGVRFDTTIGPSGSSYPMGSETEILLRLGRQGQKAWFTPGAVVEHLIRREQMTQPWVLHRAIRWGRGQYRLSAQVKSWMGIPRHLFRDVPKEIIRMGTAWLTFNPGARFRARWRLNVLRGKAIEARITARERNTQQQSALSAG